MKRMILIFVIALLLVYLIIITTDYMKIDTGCDSSSEKFDGSVSQSQGPDQYQGLDTADVKNLNLGINTSANTHNMIGNVSAQNKIIYYPESETPSSQPMTQSTIISHQSLKHIGVGDTTMGRTNILNGLATGLSSELSSITPDTKINDNLMTRPKIHFDLSSENSSDNSSGSSSMSSGTYTETRSDIQTSVTNIPTNIGKQPDNTAGEMCEPIETKCNADKCGLDNLHPILDPRFNMRETAKQCLLLEDHLNNTKKRCYDCIRKHFLTIDGFLEEAVSLEKDNKERDYYRRLYLEWIKLEKLYAKNPRNSDNLDDISKKIRVFRKPLVERYFDTVSEYDD